MKRTLFSLLAAALMATAPAGAGQMVPSKIGRVTLFSDQALVQRTASAVVDKGVTTLAVEIAPFRMDPDSVTARVTGQGEILSVQYRQIPVADSPREKIAGLEEKLRTLERSKRNLTDRRAALDRQNTFLDAFIDFSKVQVPKEIQTRLPNAEDLSRTLAFLDTGYAGIDAQRQEVDKAREELDRNIDSTRRELAALSRPGKKTRQAIEVMFRADQAQTLAIEAEYLAKNAFWKPVYKVSVPESLASAELTLFSQIRQKTGEDWKAIDLTVSSAIPLKGTRLPEPSSWVLDIPRIARNAARAMDGFSLKKSASMPETMAMAEPEAEDAVEADFAQAHGSREVLSFSYALPQPLDIASQDKETVLPLRTKTLTGHFSHFSVPRQQPLTFLVLDAESDGELLAGPLNVYFAGQYVGKTTLDEKRAGERFKLSLGADRNVRVKRERISDKVLETRFGTFDRNRTVRELAYRITAENLKQSAVTVNIIDSVPVSRTDRVQVKDLTISPEPTEEAYSGREGVLRWELVLAPGQHRTIDIRFAVVYPKDQPPPEL
ncbi:MAG: mucoidy inhibitor MuiA family protein [Desulfobacterales bacterium]|nr:mucoidy inhibitor MuiA family protein [Desulfobacterales bacterium]